MANRTQENATIYSHIQVLSGRISRLWLTEYKKIPQFIAIWLKSQEIYKHIFIMRSVLIIERYV